MRLKMIDCQFKNNELALLLKSIGTSVDLVNRALGLYHSDFNGSLCFERRHVRFCQGYLDCLMLQRRFLGQIISQLKKHTKNPLNAESDIEGIINFQFRNNELPLFLKSIGRSVAETDRRVYYYYHDDYDEDLYLDKRQAHSCKRYLECLKVQEKLLSSIVPHLKGCVNG